MSFRQSALEDSVVITHDGHALHARPGESLAHALIAADRLVLSRSPKLHRPRGPFCLTGECDGCLLRVDGVPNVAACQHRVCGGEVLQTQNVLGSREVDLLQANDFLFPHGIDHHRLFAGVRGVSALVTRLARRIAGLGNLPDLPAELGLESSDESWPALIIGGGVAGLSAARGLGEKALLVEMAPELGGVERLLNPAESVRRVEDARNSGAQLRTRATAIGIYEPAPERALDEGHADAPRAGESPRTFEVLVARPGGMLRVRTRCLILACGSHAVIPEFANSDLPGIFSARAGLELLRSGISPGERVAVLGLGPVADCAARELGSQLAVRLQNLETVLGAEGRTRVSGLRFREHDEGRRLKVDAVLCDGPPAPSFELAVQAGARVQFNPDLGFVPEAREHDHCVASGVYCIGAAAGAAEAAEHQGYEAGRTLGNALRG
ncbi:MAG TPA: 2Fe-2S iron-sulfur cluster-binding protein [Polyangiaceae bacterium]|nr:2Fe-2S iron-sulfur cluster-binding protein [Polyangiaceae bacterium]